MQINQTCAYTLESELALIVELLLLLNHFTVGFSLCLNDHFSYVSEKKKTLKYDDGVLYAVLNCCNIA